MSEVNTKAQVEELKKKQRQMSKMHLQIQCNCTHSNKKGESTLAPSHKGTDRKLSLYCKLCHKEVSVQVLEAAELHDAIRTIDVAIDTIKLTTDPRNEESVRRVEKIAKLQYQLIVELEDMYQACLVQQKKGNNNNRSHNNNDRSGWNPPRAT